MPHAREPCILISYNPALGAQAAARFVIPESQLSESERQFLRELLREDPLLISYDSELDRLSRKFDAILPTRRRSMERPVRDDEALIDVIELRYNLLSTRVVENQRH